MRTLIILLSLVVTTAALAQEHDIRMFGNKAVDLAPVHKWLAKREGERPLPHWKQIEIVSYKGQHFAYSRCKVKFDDGDTREILIGNLPAAIKRRFETLADLKAQSEALLLEIRRRNAAIGMAEAAFPAYASQSINEYEYKAVARSQINFASLSVERMLDMHAEVLAKASELLAQKATELAMSINRKYSDIEIWDCGVKASK